MDKIKIGVLGCADIAMRLLVPNMLASEKYDVIAFASRTIERAKVFSQEFGGRAIEGYENLLKLDSIEAIYIPLPTGLHFKWIVKSLQAGKHVFCEKSLTENTDETEYIIKLAKERQLVVMENFMFPLHSQIGYVKSKLEEGIIGDLKLMRSAFGFPPFNIDSNIRYKKDLGGGALLDAGAYTLMAAQLFLGNQLNILSAFLDNEGQEVDFQGSIHLVNKKGVSAQLAFGFDNFYQNNIELWGSKGKLIIDRAFTAGPGFSPKIIVEKQGRMDSIELPEDNHFVKILNKFYNAVKTGNFSVDFKTISSQSKFITKVRKYAQK